jgi:hypothetical protein
MTATALITNKVGCIYRICSWRIERGLLELVMIAYLLLCFGLNTLCTKLFSIFHKISSLAAQPWLRPSMILHYWLLRGISLMCINLFRNLDKLVLRWFGGIWLRFIHIKVTKYLKLLVIWEIRQPLHLIQQSIFCKHYIKLLNCLLYLLALCSRLELIICAIIEPDHRELLILVDYIRCISRLLFFLLD